MAAGRVFREEFRIALAQRILNGESVCALSNEFKIRRSVLYRWRDGYRERGAAGLSRPKGRPPGKRLRGEYSGRSTHPATAEAGFRSSQGVNQIAVTATGGASLSSCQARYCKCSAEPSRSSRVMLASPSARTDSSSCGSRHALECSSAHREPCTPLPGPGMKPAAEPEHRIGEEDALPRYDYVLIGIESNQRP